MSKLNQYSILLGAALALGSLTACEQEGPAERAGEKIDNMVEQAGEKIEEAGEKVEEAAEKAEKKSGYY